MRAGCLRGEPIERVRARRLIEKPGDVAPEVVEAMRIGRASVARVREGFGRIVEIHANPTEGGHQMPQVPVKEVRLSELHLPEIKRDDIVRSLSEIRLPEIDLSRLERPRIDLPEAVSKFEWPKIDLSSVDVGKAMAGVATAAHIGRRAHRPRWPLAVGLIVAGLVGWTILSNGALRARLARGVGAIRERISAVRSNRHDRHEIDRDHPIAFSAVETAPIDASPFADSTTIEATGYPAGLGSNNGDGIPAFEETGSPA
jgi:hypothetical protein